MATPLMIPATKRLVFMLGWDIEVSANVSKKPSFWENLKGRVVVPLLGEDTTLAIDPDGSCDLDLCCYLFDESKNLIDSIRPGMGRDVNDNESIYHSGDDETGRSGEFDEELSIDLAHLPGETKSIVLYVRINNDAEISVDTQAKYRVMNATDGKILLDHNLPFEQEKEKGCVLGYLQRREGLWVYTPLHAYTFEHPDSQEMTLLGPYL